MKNLMMGVAVLALTASAANAGSFDHGASTVQNPFGPGEFNFSGNNNFNVFGPGDSWVNGGGGARPGQVANLIAVGGFGVEEIASWIDISGQAEDDSEAATKKVEAAFTLKGKVSKDCSFYMGDVNNVLDFGQIGINTHDDAGLDVAFDMVDDAEAEIETNVAGCNTENTITIAKENGAMESNYTGAFDKDQFTNRLKYRVQASWTGVNAGGSGGQSASTKTLNVGLNEQDDTRNQGAWKSHFKVKITIPAPAESLVAGTYRDKLTITLQAI